MRPIATPLDAFMPAGSLHAAIPHGNHLPVPVASCADKHIDALERVAQDAHAARHHPIQAWITARRLTDMMQALGPASCCSKSIWQNRAQAHLTGSFLAHVHAGIALGQGRMGDAIELLEARACWDTHARADLFAAYMRRGAGGDIDMAHAIFSEGHLGALGTALIAWPGVGPLPGYVRHRVAEHTETGVNGLLGMLNNLKLPPGTNRAVCVAVLDEAASVWLARQQPQVTRPMFLNARFMCTICHEDMPEAERVSFAACRCDAMSLCTTCLAGAVCSSDSARTRDRCPTGCGAFLDRGMIEMASLEASQRTERTERVLSLKLAQLPHWVACAGMNCPGGSQAIPGQNISITCPLCATVNQIDRAVTDITLFRTLLEGLSASHCPNGLSMIRECFHCAAPTEKGDQCAHMTCTSCRQHWDFVVGDRALERSDRSRRFDNNGVSGQSYRPLRDGVLGRAGFFDGLPHGALTLAQQRLVLWRAEAWLRPGGLAGPVAQAQPDPGAAAPQGDVLLSTAAPRPRRQWFWQPRRG